MWGQVPQDGGRRQRGACVHAKGSPERQGRWRCVREARHEGGSSWVARDYDDVVAVVLHQLEKKGEKKTDPSCLRGDGGWVACVCLRG